MKKFFRLRSPCLVGIAVMLHSAFSSLASEAAARTDFRQPEFFPILPWDPLHGWDGKARDCEINGLESIAQCNFNFAGFVQPQDLARCRKLGLAAIVMPSGAGLVPLKYQQEWKSLSDQEIERRIKAMVSEASGPAVRGFFIMDEPGASDFPALGKAVAAVKKYAPGKLAYINLFPDYATLGAPDTSQLGTSNYVEYLERFVREVKPQILSYDNYQVQYSNDLQDRKLAASYFRNLLEVRKIGHKYGLPCLHIVAANQLRPGHTIPSQANLLLQAYTTLAAGFRGVTWYTYFGQGYEYASIGKDGNKTLTWNYLREVNSQVAALAPCLSRLASTGVYFTVPPIAEGLPLLPGKFVTNLVSTMPMMAGEFVNQRGEPYVMVVNLSLERSANFTVTITSGGQLEQISAVTGNLRPFTPGKDGFWLPAGQGILLRSPSNPNRGRSSIEN